MSARRAAVAAGLILAAALSGAQPDDRPAFSAIDTDGDDKLSRSEFRTQFERRIKERANAGGSRASAYAGMSPQRQRQLTDRMFDRGDANGDGYVDADEWRAAVDQAGQRRAGRRQ